MPRLGRDPAPAGPVVRGFAGGEFVVDGARYRALLLTPERAEAWEPPTLAELDIADFAPLLALDPLPEFVLLGTGRATAFAPRALVAGFEAAGVGIEAMDSRAAARAWTMLRAEERWIAAALLPL